MVAKGRKNGRFDHNLSPMLTWAACKPKRLDTTLIYTRCNCRNLLHSLPPTACIKENCILNTACLYYSRFARRTSSVLHAIYHMKSIFPKVNCTFLQLPCSSSPQPLPHGILGIPEVQISDLAGNLMRQLLHLRQSTRIQLNCKV